MTTRQLSLEPFDRIDLVVFNGSESFVAPLSKGQAVVIGREAPAQVRLDAEGLSRRHARVSWVEAPSVEDLGSTNGTKLNGVKISKLSLLAPGDVLTLGEVRIAVVGRREGDAPAVTLDGYERFVARIEEELSRARHFGRSFGLLRVRPLTTTHVSRFAQAVRDALRPVDRLGAYASGELLALLPEADEAETRRVGKALRAASSVPLGLSTSVFPGDGADAQTLLAVLSSGARVLRPGQTLAHSVKGDAPRGPLLASERMKRLYETARRVGNSPLPVLIHGETGSGKEVLARELHDSSPRAKKPFVAINCAAIAPTLIESTLFGHEKGAFTGATRRARGLFEQADGGTVLLDEVGELSLAAQAALLRVLEARRFTRVGGEGDVAVDIRILAATHRNLEQAVLAGTFRADLRFRLEGITLRLPALRDRREEVVALARYFFDEFTRANKRQLSGFSAHVEAALECYSWPGNIRELRNVIERAVVVASGPGIELADLPESVVTPRASAGESAPIVETVTELPPESGLQEFVAAQQRTLERRLISQALEKCGGNQTRAAKLLKLPLRTLVHKLKTLELR